MWSFFFSLQNSRPWRDGRNKWMKYTFSSQNTSSTLINGYHRYSNSHVCTRRASLSYTFFSRGALFSHNRCYRRRTHNLILMAHNYFLVNLNHLCTICRAHRSALITLLLSHYIISPTIIRYIILNTPQRSKVSNQ